MDGAVRERGGKHPIHTAVLVEERDPVELGTHDGHLEVVAGTGAVLDGDLDCVGERLREEDTNSLGFHAVMLDVPGYPAGVRLLRAVLLFKLGFWAGMITSAAIVKQAFPSQGDEESDELRLVAIQDGIDLKSRAQAFRGGSMLAWLGGISVDLREATLAPDARLEVGSLFGGIAIRVPPGWWIESKVKAIGGGVTVPEAPEAEDAPTLRLEGFTAFGGIAVQAKAAES